MSDHRITMTMLGATGSGKTTYLHGMYATLSMGLRYLVLGRRQRRGRIVNEDELDRGTWAAKLSFRR
ncbi:ATPase/DNA packaging protein, partial [Streptomyces virginiae]|uniref:ATPase/DNA packaging protein n=1 Tax=Streptomyces virginiae TaxID=1961 RepID=UPI00344BB02A